MAVEVENTSQLDEFLRVLKRRFWWILVPAVLIGTIGVIYAVVVPKKFVAKAQVIVYDRPGQKTVGGGTLAVEGKVAGVKIKSPQRVKSVLKKLAWEEYEELPTGADAYDYEKKVNDRIDVNTPPMPPGVGQQVVSISFSHTDADLASDFLRELLESWKNEVLDANSRQLRQEYDRLEEEIADLTKQRKEWEDRLRDKQREHDIAPTQGRLAVDPRFNNPIVDEINGLERELNAQETEEGRKETRLDQLRAQYRRMKDTVPVRTGSGAPALSAVGRAQAELDAAVKARDLSNYAPTHSKWKQLNARVEQAKANLDRLIAVAPQEDQVQTTEPNEAKFLLNDQIMALEDDLTRTRRSIAKTKEKLLDARTRSNVLVDVYGDLDNMRKQRSDVDALLKEARLERQKINRQLDRMSGPQGNPFDDLERVTASDKPTEPNAWLLSVVSILAGIGAGMGLALLLEFSRNCFRSINDIVQSMEVPVLGAINRIETRKQRSVRHVQRLVLGVGMGLMVGVVAYALWAWVFQPHLLSPRLIDSFDRLRDALG